MDLEENLNYVRKKRIEEAHLYSNYIKYYDKNDYMKSAEFLWGAITKLTNALEVLYVGKPGKHKENMRFLKDLASREENCEEYRDYISAAHALHAHYYHNWIDEDDFCSYIEKAEKLRRWIIIKLDGKEKELLTG